MKRIAFYLCVVCFFALAGCASNSKKQPLVALQELSAHQLKKGKNPTNNIRLKALRDTALSLSAQEALAYRSKQIDAELEKRSASLDSIFNFYSLMLSTHVIPPVLVESNDSLNLASSDSIRLASKTYKLVQQAHFVTAPPTWRDYLMMNFTKPDEPDATLLPQNDVEQDYWQKYVVKGWKNGIQQANDIYLAEVSRLKRDYEGMVLYHKLVNENMISSPYVAKTNMGITGGGDNLRINDNILRLTSLPLLKSDSSKWNPLLLKKLKDDE